MSVRSLVSIASLLVASVAQAQVTLTHVHGLAYSPDGQRLMIPSHHGLAVYEGGKWSKAPGPQHDYMGFAATAGALYSSGHPAPGSTLVNPFGLMRSRDGGKTWTLVSKAKRISTCWRRAGTRTQSVWNS
jgi:hypothetical protein